MKRKAHQEKTLPRACGLYVHVPFCVRKCAYCAFYSQAMESRDGLVEKWLQGIEQEAERAPEGFAPDTVFVGGGTPTALEEGVLARLLEGIGERWGKRVKEWTVEGNPGTLTAGKLEAMRKAGVTRLSLGAQSFSEGTLAKLGRIHSPEEIRDAVSMARDEGIGQVSLDLMYGWPAASARETLDTVRADVDAALALEPDHISAYCLEIEEGTPLAARRAAGETVAAPEAWQRRAYDWIRRRLAGAGFVQYELSNFARPGRECHHNLLYWTGGSYIGLGPAAHSHWNGVRWGNSPTLPAWSAEFRETLPPRRKACETLVMGLRRTAGWGREEFRAATGFDYVDLRGAEIARLAGDGMLLAPPNRIRLPASAYFTSDAVFAALV